MKLLLKLILIGVITLSVLVGLRTLGQMIHPGATHYWVAKPVTSSGFSSPPMDGLQYWWHGGDLVDGSSATLWTDKISGSNFTSFGAAAPVVTNGYLQFSGSQKMTNASITFNAIGYIVYVLNITALSDGNPILARANEGDYLRNGYYYHYDQDWDHYGAYPTGRVNIVLKWTQSYGTISAYTNGVANGMTSSSYAPGSGNAYPWFLGYCSGFGWSLTDARLYDILIYTNNNTTISNINWWATNSYAP